MAQKKTIATKTIKDKEKTAKNTENRSTNKTKTSKKSEENTICSPRTMLANIVQGANKNIFAFVERYTLPVKSNGTDYVMTLTLTDESTKDKSSSVDIKVFFKDIKDLPQIDGNMKVIVKIRSLTLKKKLQMNSYLLDRTLGMFLFKVDKDGPSYIPYASSPARRTYKEDSIDRDEIFSLSTYFCSSISIGIVPFPSIICEQTLFSTFGYVSNIEEKEDYILVRLIDMFEKVLNIRVWNFKNCKIPKIGSYIVVEDLNAKKIKDDYIICDISMGDPFKWRIDEKKEYREIMEPMLTSADKSKELLWMFQIGSREIERHKEEISRISLHNILSDQKSTVAEKEVESEHEYTSIEEILELESNTVISLKKDSELYKQILSLEVRRCYRDKNKNSISYSKDGLRISTDEPIDYRKITAYDIALYKNTFICFVPLEQKKNTNTNSSKECSYLLFIRQKKTPIIYLFLSETMWTFPHEECKLVSF